MSDPSLTESLARITGDCEAWNRSYHLEKERREKLERDLNRMRQSCEWADATRLRLAKVFDCTATASDVCIQAEKLQRELAAAKRQLAIGVTCENCGGYLPGHATGAGDICSCER